MNLFRRIREAAERFAEAVQEKAKDIIEQARERFSRSDEEPLYKEETTPAWPEESLSDRLKEEDLKAKEEQHKRAFESFNKNFMPDGEGISRYEYDEMWDAIGEYSNDSEALGSPDIIEIYDAMTEKFGYDVDADFIKTFLDTVQRGVNTDLPWDTYRETFIDAVYKALNNTDSVGDFYESLEEGNPFI